MKTVTIRCEHTVTRTKLRIAEHKIYCIQCGLIQIFLSLGQAAKVQRHCSCMSANLYYEHSGGQHRAVMTIDPSQLDLGGKVIATWLVG